MNKILEKKPLIQIETYKFLLTSKKITEKKNQAVKQEEIKNNTMLILEIE